MSKVAAMNYRHISILALTLAAMKAFGQSPAPVSVSKFTAKTIKQTDSSCIGFANLKVKIGQPITFEMRNQQPSSGAGATWDWPACFNVTATVTLGPGMVSKNLAVKWTPSYSPSDRLECQNAARIACNLQIGQGFYYICDPPRKIVCSKQAGQTVATTATVCPPRAVKGCDRLSDAPGGAEPYCRRSASLNAAVEVYYMKSDAEYKAVKANADSWAKLVHDYKIDPVNRKFLLSFSPPDEEVNPWFKLCRAEKVGCQQSVLQYSLGARSP